MYGLLHELVVASSSYKLPSGIHPVTTTGTGLMQLGVSILNVVLGIGGFLIIAYGMMRFMKVIWLHLKGEKADYTHGFIKSAGGMPTVLAAGLDIIIGLIVVGLFLSGAWIAIVDGLISTGGHIGNVISKHLGG